MTRSIAPLLEARPRATRSPETSPTIDAATATPSYRRIVAARFGGPDVLRMQDEAVPEPTLGEVRVRVLAVGVGFPDILMREGMYPGGPRPPFTPGEGLIGRVDRLGPGVSSVAVGALVAALPGHGSYAELVCLPEEMLVAVPGGLDIAQAACLVLNYMTAYQILKRTVRARPGERVLVHGAAGGVGSAALELGRLMGLELYGTASAADADFVRELGAIPIDYRSGNFVRRLREVGGADIILDGIGGSVSPRSYRALRTGGRLVLFGNYGSLQRGRRSLRKLVVFYLSGAATLLTRALPDRRNVGIYHIYELRDRRPDWFRADLTTLFQLLGERQIAPRMGGRFSLDEAASAHELLGRGGVRGTIVLTANEPAGRRNGGSSSHFASDLGVLTE